MRFWVSADGWLAVRREIWHGDSYCLGRASLLPAVVPWRCGMVQVALIRIRRLAAVLALASGVVLFAGVPGPARAAGTLPDSVAGLGDSITRGFNACGFFLDCTSRSWSTGSYSYVNSHYRRILANNPAIYGHNHNDAADGARASDLARQAGTAVNQQVEYVTIEIGANDACRSSESL